MDLKVKLIENGKLPLQATDGAANFDFYARKIEWVHPNKAIIYLGVAFDIPAGYKIEVEPRSSFTHTGWVMANSPAQIDEDFKGELQIRIIAIPNDLSIEGRCLLYPKLPFKEGERVCQGNLVNKIATDLVLVEELTNSIRGNGSFGSSGKN